MEFVLNKYFFFFKLNIDFLKLYFIASVELMYGTTALFFLKLNNIFFTNLSEKFGLAAS